MFYYLSFLRPPPVSVPASARSITITPQIANDLRTELKDDEPSDIYYTWRQDSDTTSSSTKWNKLTTYDPPRTTYTAISVPLPPDVKSGESWQLGLSCEPLCSEVETLPLGNKQILRVWSEGIQISRAESTVVERDGPSPNKKRKEMKGKASASAENPKESRGKQVEKQTRICREWNMGIRARTEENKGVSTEDKILRIVEQTSFDLDKKIWDSGLALSSWLHSLLTNPSSRIPPNPSFTQDLARLLSSPNGKGNVRALELGAGTGLVSLVLAGILRIVEELEVEKDDGEDGAAKSWTIMTTDLPSAIPLIEENITLNSHLWTQTDVPIPQDNSPETKTEPLDEEAPHIETRKTVVEVVPMVLDWDQEVPDWVWGNEVEELDLDLVIAADVTYNTASFPSLLSTLMTLLTPRPHSTKHPLLLLAYKQRDPSERDLWDMLKEKGVWMEKIAEVPGKEAEDVEDREGVVEIWMGGTSKRDEGEKT